MLSLSDVILTGKFITDGQAVNFPETVHMPRVCYASWLLFSASCVYLDGLNAYNCLI